MQGAMKWGTRVQGGPVPNAVDTGIGALKAQPEANQGCQDMDRREAMGIKATAGTQRESPGPTQPHRPNLEAKCPREQADSRETAVLQEFQGPLGYAGI